MKPEIPGAAPALSPEGELLIYYKVAQPDLVIARLALADWAAQLQQHWPALRFRLMQRPQPDANQQWTWMEAYSLDGSQARHWPAGFFSALEVFESTSQNWTQGKRHREHFEPCV